MLHCKKISGLLRLAKPRTFFEKINPKVEKSVRDLRYANSRKVLRLENDLNLDVIVGSLRLANQEFFLKNSIVESPVGSLRLADQKFNLNRKLSHC